MADDKNNVPEGYQVVLVGNMREANANGEIPLYSPPSESDGNDVVYFGLRPGEYQEFAPSTSISAPHHVTTGSTVAPKDTRIEAVRVYGPEL